jgi:hypothetical protein
VPSATLSRRIAAAIVLSCLFSAPTALQAEGGAEPENPAEYRVQKPAPIVDLAASRGGVSWVSRGPAPTQSAQVRVPPDNEVAGAVHRIAAHPTNPNIIVIGSVNGGVWATTDGTAARPTWRPLTDGLPSQSIGDVVFDPTDPNRQTLLVGTGRWSNFARRGDDEIGAYRSTDFGTTWTQLGQADLLGQRLIAVAARGSKLFAASNTGGLFVSSNTGQNWTLASGSNGLPTGAIAALAEDRADANRLAVVVRAAAPKVLISNNLGDSWSDVSAGLSGLTGTGTFARLSFGPSSVLYLALINGGALSHVYRSADLGATWTQLDLPAVHPGTQGEVNTALVADPNDPNIVFVSGDRITASPFTGNVVRVDASQALGSQRTVVVDAGANSTAPHADTRHMVFDANGDILQSDDGGIYRLVSPNTGTRRWVSVIGNMNVMEVHNVAQDTITGVAVIGTQDNGTHQQQSANNTRWTWINGGDGGDVAVDSTTLGPSGSYRYVSSQNFGGFRRLQFDALNASIASLFFPALPVAGDVQFVTPIELNNVAEGRLLVGGLNNIYESNNATTSAPTWTNLGAPGANRQAVSFGAVDNADAMYVGRNAAVFKRLVAGPFVATTALPAGAAIITDVVMDPDNSQRVYAVDDNQVFRSTDAGTTWTDVTGNLPAISSVDFRSVEYINLPSGDLIAIGTRSGVFISDADGNSWDRLGGVLPDVLVFDLEFKASQSLLFAGTLGRGVWTYQFNATQLFKDGFE